MRKLNIHIEKLITDLEKEGISFYFDQEITKIKTIYGNNIEKRLENVVFEKDSIKYKIYEGLFFRDSGQRKYFKAVKTKKGFDLEIAELDDSTFYDFQKIHIQNFFN